MPLDHIEHFLLQTEDIEATKDWYVNVLGFRVGPSPDFKFPVYWLYLGDRDVLHITTGGKNVSENRKKYVGQQSDVATGTGVIRGRIVAGESGKPLRRATVTLRAPELGANGPRTTSTNLDGRYEFKDLSAARYRVSVRRS